MRHRYFENEDKTDKASNIDSIFEGEGKPLQEEVKEPESGKETPFKEVDQEEVLFDGEEDLFKDEVLILEDDDYFEIENVVESELDSINFWLKGPILLAQLINLFADHPFIN